MKSLLIVVLCVFSLGLTASVGYTSNAHEIEKVCDVDVGTIVLDINLTAIEINSLRLIMLSNEAISLPLVLKTPKVSYTNRGRAVGRTCTNVLIKHNNSVSVSNYFIHRCMNCLTDA
jgi:hypothetical protein